jgi:hypothetical protein
LLLPVEMGSIVVPSTQRHVSFANKRLQLHAELSATSKKSKANFLRSQLFVFWQLFQLAQGESDEIKG